MPGSQEGTTSTRSGRQKSILPKHTTTHSQIYKCFTKHTTPLENQFTKGLKCPSQQSPSPPPKARPIPPEPPQTPPSSHPSATPSSPPASSTSRTTPSHQTPYRTS